MRGDRRWAKRAAARSGGDGAGCRARPGHVRGRGGPSSLRRAPRLHQVSRRTGLERVLQVGVRQGHDLPPHCELHARLRKGGDPRRHAATPARLSLSHPVLAKRGRRHLRQPTHVPPPPRGDPLLRDGVGAPTAQRPLALDGLRVARSREPVSQTGLRAPPGSDGDRRQDQTQCGRGSASSRSAGGHAERVALASRSTFSSGIRAPPAASPAKGSHEKRRRGRRPTLAPTMPNTLGVSRPRSAGARTVPLLDQLPGGWRQRRTDWNYITAKRFVLVIERSVGRGTRWVVFEPNNESLTPRARKSGRPTPADP